MNRYVTGGIIKKFREREGMTQSQLADKLIVSNKTISKWENGKGLPDISLLNALAKALNVSLIELMSGEVVNNSNMANSMNKAMWYVCPACGNVIHAMGDAVISSRWPVGWRSRHNGIRYGKIGHLATAGCPFFVEGVEN